MKTLSLLVFAAVFLLSSAFSRNTRTEERRNLVEGNEGNRKLLDKEKPHGPKLALEDINPALFVGIFSKQEATPKKYLSQREKDRKKDVNLKKNGYKAFREGTKRGDKHVSEDKMREPQEPQPEAWMV